MEYKTLQIAENFRENILYDSDSLALAVCSDHFDDYLHREWGCHWHDEFEFGLVLQGVVEYTIYNEHEQLSVHKISVGDGIFLNAGCFHSVKGLEPGTVMAGIILPTNFFNTESFRTIIIRIFTLYWNRGRNVWFLHKAIRPTLPFCPA